MITRDISEMAVVQNLRRSGFLSLHLIQIMMRSSFRSRSAASLMSEGSSSRMTSIARASSSLQEPSTSLLPFPPARRLFSSSSSSFEQSNAATPPPATPRRQVDSSRQPRPDTATNKAERTLRRFWKKVDVAYYPSSSPYPHLRIRLDGRNLKTPSGNLLAIPADRPLLASLIAREWAEQDKVLKMHSLPMTSLAARAIDGLSEKKVREQVCDELIKYLETETICFHETHPPVLVQLQKEKWDPILSWTSQYFKLPPIRVFTDILGVEQDKKIVEALRHHISTYDQWDLSALERIIRSSKSFLIGVRLLESVKTGKEHEFGAEEGAAAAEVEVKSQTERWGEVEDTHDVDHADLRKTLASVACAVVKDDVKLASEVASETINE